MSTEEALRALDAATRAIAGELDLDRVLQLMVDSVRSLIGSRYAALGIVDAAGRIERFITSGVSPEQRARIGAPPSGHGLLGTIIREGAPLRIPDIGRHPDTFGFPPNHPPMHSFLGVPVVVANEAIGNFYLTEKIGTAEFTDADQELVELFAGHAGIAIQNARLHRQVQALAVADERLRISRDLHDGIIQSIYAVGLLLEDVPELMAEDPSEAASRVDRAIDRLHMTIADIRTFITRLATAPESTLAAALGDAAAEANRGHALELSMDVAAADTVDGRVSPEAANELLQIVREAMSNAARHSGAAHALLRVTAEEDGMTLTVEDDGRGFDAASPPRRGHFGLSNLAKRAAAAGGTMTLDTAPGRGTRIVVRIPLELRVPA